MNAHPHPHPTLEQTDTGDRPAVRASGPGLLVSPAFWVGGALSIGVWCLVAIALF